MQSLEVSPAVDMQFMGLLLISLLSMVSCNTSYLPGASFFSPLARNLTSCSFRLFLKLYSGPNHVRTERGKEAMEICFMLLGSLPLIREDFPLSDCKAPHSGHHPPTQYCLGAGARENEKKRKTKYTISPTFSNPL